MDKYTMSAKDYVLLHKWDEEHGKSYTKKWWKTLLELYCNKLISFAEMFELLK